MGVLRRTTALAAAALAVAVVAPAQAAPVPSLTPKATAKLWEQLVHRPRPLTFGTSDCRPARILFYAPTDWRRLATKLASRPSPCAHYYVSVPPLVADKTQLRADEAWRIRALGPQFHALAEVSFNGWDAWVKATGRSWYDAGVEARKEMTATGFDVAAGDTWALNELSSAVRAGTGNARANIRAFLGGLYEGGGVAARGVVWTAGISQGTPELSVYQARLQDWLEDDAFWADAARATRDWSQEVYGDVRNYAVAGASPETRRAALHEYLLHQTALAAAAPASAPAGRTLLGSASAPLANAAWQYDAAFGWTNVSVELMADYVTAQTDALRAAGTPGFGFAWSPKNLAAVPEATFATQTATLLDRLAASIADSDGTGAGACGTSWCRGSLDGAAATSGWRSFATWQPSRLVSVAAPTELAAGATSPATVELQTSAGVAYTAGLPVRVVVSSSSPAVEVASAPEGPWSTSAESTIGSGASRVTVHVRGAGGGTAVVTASAAGKTAASFAVSVAATAPPPAPPPAPPRSGGGGGIPDIALEASVAPAAPRVGESLLYTVRVRNTGGPASKVRLLIDLPAHVAYEGSTSDRGAGCTGRAGTVACDLDFLADELVATVRVSAAVKAPGGLRLVVAATTEPVDPVPARVELVTEIAAPAAVAPVVAGVRTAAAATVSKPTVSKPAVRRSRGVATVSGRVTVPGGARLTVRLTPSASQRALQLLAGTTVAGTRSRALGSTATGTTSRAGTYAFTARVASAKLVRGRAYLVRVGVTGRDGRTQILRVRVTG